MCEVICLSKQRRKLVLKQKRRQTKKGQCRWLTLVFAIMLWWGYKEIASRFQPPEAILVLGGSEQREKFAAEFARQHPDLPIWISGGSPKDYASRLFANAGIERNRLNLDYQAVDTVTNFTTLVDELEERQIKKIYLITSEYHMRRACVIGEIVLGSRGIEFQAVAVPSKRSPESIKKAIRDGARAIFWVFTGHTGSTFK